MRNIRFDGIADPKWRTPFLEADSDDPELECSHSRSTVGDYLSNVMTEGEEERFEGHCVNCERCYRLLITYWKVLCELCCAEDEAEEGAN